MHTKIFEENTHLIFLEISYSFFLELSYSFFSHFIAVFLELSYSFFLELSYNLSDCKLFLVLKKMDLNLFVPNAPFLYPLKTSENLTVF